jgi:hypothetical protein
MEVFDLNDKWTMATALQAQLHKNRQGAGMILFGTETGELLRLSGTPQQVEEIGCGRDRIHADPLETPGHLRRHDCGTIVIGNATGVPEEGQHRLRSHRLAIRHTVPTDIGMGFMAETPAEFSHEPRFAHAGFPYHAHHMSLSLDHPRPYGAQCGQLPGAADKRRPSSRGMRHDRHALYTLP